MKSQHIPGVFVIGAMATVLTACNPPTPIALVATPDAIRTEIESSKAPLTLVHAWATWCGPCREEFPELVDIQKAFSKKGLRLILVSADEPSDVETVETFLSEQGSPIDSLVSTELSQEFIETLSPKWAGSLPASFFYVDGKLVEEWEGKRTYEQYAKTIETHINNKE